MRCFKYHFYIILVTAVTTLPVWKVNGQMGQDKLGEIALGCDRVTVKAMDAIPRLYSESKYDSFSAELNLWEGKCGLIEPIFSLRVLMAVEDDSMHHYLRSLLPGADSTSDSLLLKNVYHYLVAYRSAGELYRKVKKKDNASVQDCEAYYTMLKVMARKLIGKSRLTGLEEFIVRWYAGQEGAERLFTPRSNALHVKDESDGMVCGPQFFITGGYAVATGGYAATGNHTAIGGMMGAKFNEWIINLDFGFLGPASAAHMMRRYNDTDYQITSTSGSWGGFALGYDLWHRSVSEFDVVGFVGLTTLIPKSSKYLAGGSYYENKSELPEMKSPDFGIGAEYKYYFRHLTEREFLKHMYASITAKYDFVSFKNPGGTDIRGGAFTARITLGINSYDNGVPVDD